MAHEKYRPPKAVILAAGLGSRMGALTQDKPKCLLSVGGSTILERTLRTCLSCGISQFVIVLGHRDAQIRQFVDKTFRGVRVTYAENDGFRTSGTGYSLLAASRAIGSADFVKIDGDAVFDTRILRQVLDNDHPSLLCLDRGSREGAQGRADLGCVVVDDEQRVLNIGPTVDAASASGTTIGLDKIGAKAAQRVFAELAQMMQDVVLHKAPFEAAYGRLVAQGVPFHTLDVTGMNWVRVKTPDDYAAAQARFVSPATAVSRDQQKTIDEAASNAAHGAAAVWQD